MRKQTKLERYKKKVLSRYDLYNNVFLTLPFESINDTGRLLPLFSNYCKEGFDNTCFELDFSLISFIFLSVPTPSIL